MLRAQRSLRKAKAINLTTRAQFDAAVKEATASQRSIDKNAARMIRDSLDIFLQNWLRQASDFAYVNKTSRLLSTHLKACKPPVLDYAH